MKAIVAGARRFGPYLLAELFLPGGTLIAIAMWLSRRRAAPG
jgi:hypothetical protein